MGIPLLKPLNRKNTKEIMRNKIIGLLGLALAGLLFTGCAAFQTSTTQIPPKVVKEKPTADKALIIVDGSESWAGMAKLYAVEVFDNKISVGKVGPHGKLVWLRDPGTMELKLNPGAGRYITVKAGETYQFKADCNATYRKGLFYTFAGPGAPINQLPKEDALRIKQEVESVLGDGKRVRRMEVYGGFLSPKNTLFSIVLDVPEASQESDCRKVMQVLANDPMIPYQDNIAVMSAHSSTVKKAGAAILALVRGGIIFGTADVVEQFSNSDPSTENVTYACAITRDALMKGGDPMSYK